MIVLSLTFLTYIAAVAATRSLQVKVSMPETVSDVDHLNVTTTITNAGDQTLKLLDDPRSVLSSFTTDKFGVINSDSGVSPTFNGMHVMYIPDAAARQSRKASLFTLLGPGEFVEVSHEVFRYYNFTYSGPGAYTFTPEDTFHVLEGDGSVSVLKALTISGTVHISGKLSSSKSLGLPSAKITSPVDKRAQLQKRIQFIGCEDTETVIIGAAVDNANTACNRAINHLQNNPSGSQLETTWFGTWTGGRHRQVLATFQRLDNKFRTFEYDCKECQLANVFAYVRAGEYGIVYICPGFWEPATNMNERVDTIIHEGTHWTDTQGTEDYAYGGKDCQALARTNPDRAINNADSYGFFAINA